MAKCKYCLKAGATFLKRIKQWYCRLCNRYWKDEVEV